MVGTVLGAPLAYLVCRENKDSLEHRARKVRREIPASTASPPELLFLEPRVPQGPLDSQAYLVGREPKVTEVSLDHLGVPEHRVCPDCRVHLDSQDKRESQEMPFLLRE
ncbi:hypothetical protein JZ751_026977 [Albula glossodonta]|uniref:Uncharacterized protein n=1 Tax=Albula glossodonta TaxID=121402 RepID=A0A8T2NE23_9TELE|nr:hypothetical protein JZ751_026977 [Albula glossodonta]